MQLLFSLLRPPSAHDTRFVICRVAGEFLSICGSRLNVAYYVTTENVCRRARLGAWRIPAVELFDLCQFSFLIIRTDFRRAAVDTVIRSTLLHPDAYIDKIRSTHCPAIRAIRGRLVFSVIVTRCHTSNPMLFAISFDASSRVSILNTHRPFFCWT